jgi:nicotinamidase/pyrazinamidase
MRMNLHLLIIDPQNDFTHPQGSLFVPGAVEDCARLHVWIMRYLVHIKALHVSLDTHHFIDIAHPIFWLDSTGAHPPPFTRIRAAEVQKGQWRAAHTHLHASALAYVQALQARQREDLIIWPPHCLSATWGHNVAAPIAQALWAWETQHWRGVNFIYKGMNPLTEHYSVLQAEVPDPTDLSTMLNTDLLKNLTHAEYIVISGQALSHCVADTVRDIVVHLGTDILKKILLLEDTTSAVPGFENKAQAFVKEMLAQGMRCIRTQDALDSIG